MYHSLSLSYIGNYSVINCILNKVISKFVFKNRIASGVKRIDILSSCALVFHIQVVVSYLYKKRFCTSSVENFF